MRLSYADTLKALAEIQMIGRINNNGADSLFCPCCCVSADVKGNVSLWNTFDEASELVHLASCAVKRAVDQLKEKAERNGDKA